MQNGDCRGVAQGQIVREQLQQAKAAHANRPFMRLAGAVRGPRTLSLRKGFSASSRFRCSTAAIRSRL